MRIYNPTAVVAGLLMLFQAGFAPNATAELIPNPDGRTVFDTILQVTWLRNMNLAGSPQGQVGLTDPLMAGHFVGPSGAMDFHAAKAWVDTLNSNSYLGRNTWSLPASPHIDNTCSVPNGGPNGNSFGYNCTNNAMGSLYYQSFQMLRPNTAVRIPSTATGPFINFQPYFYWSGTNSGGSGWNSFSFNTGWQGSNVDDHYMYVLPMIGGQLGCSGAPWNHCPIYSPSGVGNLQVSDDGKTIYDPDAVDPDTGLPGVTWLADANLPNSRKFGAQCSFVDPQTGLSVNCINRDGSMSHTTAVDWIARMNAFVSVPGTAPGFLGYNQWKLPKIDPNDPCGIPNFNCTGGPLGELFYNQLGLTQDTPVVPTPNTMNTHLQPYLYWSCVENVAVQNACDYTDHAATGFEFSFSFGNGFQGTTVFRANMYVMVYFPQTTLEALTEALTAVYGPTGTAPNAATLTTALAKANAIVTSPPALKATRIWLFVQFVNAQRGLSLTDAQAQQIKDLVRAL